MRLFISIVALSALVVSPGTAWAARCAGWPETSIVFCDDFDQYCTANNPTNPWPGYPPTPDTKCATDATADTSFFLQPYHWPSFCGTNADTMGIASDSYGADSTPFDAHYYGYGATAQYHRWDLAPTVGAKHPGYNAVNGTDENPLYLRWFFGASGTGTPPNSPVYVELAMDDDVAPTDYVLKNCMTAYDCNCYNENSTATCSTGTCTFDFTCDGTCDFHLCLGGTCLNGPKVGQTCSSNDQCSLCVGGPTPGAGCLNNYSCSGCSGGPLQGQHCNTATDCGGACADGPKVGQACSSSVQCGACVGGAVEGTNCDANFDCQFPCGQTQTSTCQGGPYNGTACVQDSECAGGPIYPIINQQTRNPLIVVPHPGLSSTVRKSIAFGQLAQLDVDPCDLETGRKPTNYHANFFNGVKWDDIRANEYPGVSGSDFNNDGRAATYQMWVKTSTVVLWLDSMVGPDATQIPQHNEATIPRLYTGPFNRIAMGTGPGCQLDPTTGACITGASCFTYPREWPSGPVSWQNYALDNVVMMDGVPVSTSGACCLNDATCIEGPESTCLSQGGHFQGTNTTCAGTTCCPYPFADADHDGDVDQDDFGAFQICYNGSGAVPTGCACFNRDGDADVDATDFASFGSCWTGPNVPWSAAITPSCVP